MVFEFHAAIWRSILFKNLKTVLLRQVKCARMKQ